MQQIYLINLPEDFTAEQIDHTILKDHDCEISDLRKDITTLHIVGILDNKNCKGADIIANYIYFMYASNDIVLKTTWNPAGTGCLVINLNCFDIKEKIINII